LGEQRPLQIARLLAKAGELALQRRGQLLQGREAMALPVRQRALHRHQAHAAQAQGLGARLQQGQQAPRNTHGAARRCHRHIVQIEQLGLGWQGALRRVQRGQGLGAQRQAHRIGQRLARPAGQPAGAQCGSGPQLGLEGLGTLQKLWPIALGLQGQHGGQIRRGHLTKYQVHINSRNVPAAACPAA